MYAGTEHKMLVPTESTGNLAAAINREYEKNVTWAAKHEECWAHDVFYPTAFWSCQPTLVLLAS